MPVRAPSHLNGYEVIRQFTHPTCATVMVAMPDNPATPFVVATWWPELGNTWSWGHYAHDRAAAHHEFNEVWPRNDRRTA